MSLAAKATPTWKDGSTVAIIMAIDNVLYSGIIITQSSTNCDNFKFIIGNLGDSKSVMYRRNHEEGTGGDCPILSVPLTKDHTSASVSCFLL